MAGLISNRASRPIRMLSLILSTVFVSYLLMGASSAWAERRVALVIGNSAYVNTSALANPANDAEDMAQALRDLDFEVVVGIDLDNRGMRDTVREFGKALRGADVAMLFYAGHAMQVNGNNYLAPIDARLEFESDLDFETIPLQFIQRQMEREAKTILLFLDACRDNPLTRSFQVASRSQGSGRGLAKEQLTSSGILIAFATNPDNVALDGTGRNSPFTTALLDNIQRPDVEISTLMTDVRVQVVRDTDGQQTPWINSALLGRFYFNQEDTGTAEASDGDTDTQVAALDNSSGGARASSSQSRGVDKARIEALAWDSVRQSESVAELEIFLSTYGRGFYGKLARLRLERLKKEQGTDAPKATGQQPEAPVETASLGQPEVPAAPEAPQIAPEPQVPAAPPRDPREVKRDIQKRLASLSCNPGRPDGLWGKRSQRALDGFVRAAKVKLDSPNPDEVLLGQLNSYNGAGCPKPVVATRKTCPAGQRLSRKGNCYTPKSSTRSVTQQPRQQQVVVQPQQQPTQRQVIVRQPQQQRVIVQQPQQRQVIVHPQPQPVIVHPQPQPHPVIVHPQPQPQRPGIGAIIGGAIIGCVLGNC